MGMSLGLQVFSHKVKTSRLRDSQNVYSFPIIVNYWKKKSPKLLGLI